MQRDVANTRRGKLIVFEGLDKAGKSTQCSLLIRKFEQQGIKVRKQTFPDRSTVIGQLINAYLRGQGSQEDHAIHLLFSANRWEAAPQIEQDIAQGINVVVDRYVYSGCVYSAAKSNPNLGLEWAKKCDEGLPRPDICVFLDISPQSAAARGGYGDEKYERREFQDRVRNLFAELRNSAAKDEFAVIDGGQSYSVVEQLIFDAVSERMRVVDHEQKLLRRIQP